jgi:hypothetical protein
MILAANAAVGVITETNAEKALEVILVYWERLFTLYFMVTNLVHDWTLSVFISE